MLRGSRPAGAWPFCLRACAVRQHRSRCLLVHFHSLLSRRPFPFSSAVTGRRTLRPAILPATFCPVALPLFGGLTTIGVDQMPDSELYMDYAGVSAAGRAASDIGTNLGLTLDQTGPGCTAAALACPAFQTSAAVIDVHAAHTQNIHGHIQVINSTASGIQGSVTLTSSTEKANSSNIAGVISGEA